jgi:Replication-relaxation
MNSAPAAKRYHKPLIPAPRDESILLQFLQYRFLTAHEITALCYSKGSLTYARSRLSALSGNQDITDKDLAYGYPLWRLGFPTGKRGNNERIFSLSLTGRQMLERLGIPVSWHMRVEQLRTFSHSYLQHDLCRNRFVVALLSWAKKSKPNLRLEARLSYQIAKQRPTVEIPVQRSILKEGKLVNIPVMTKVGVIPDGEIVVTNTSTGERLLILLEIDHNTQSPQRLRTHIAALLAYVKSPHFRNTFGNMPYRIVYATQGLTGPASKSRLAYLCDFTIKFLIERKRPQDSQYFRFTTINFATLYEDANRLFGSEQPSWYLPGDVKLENPVGLFTDTKPQPQKE